jgi:hypothetical protein
VSPHILLPRPVAVNTPGAILAVVMLSPAVDASPFLHKPVKVDDTAVRRCGRCGVSFPETAEYFHRRGKSSSHQCQFHSQCKTCVAAYTKARPKADRTSRPPKYPRRPRPTPAVSLSTVSDLVTVKQAAKAAGVSIVAVRYARNKGRLGDYAFESGRPAISLTEVLALRFQAPNAVRKGHRKPHKPPKPRPRQTPLTPPEGWVLVAEAALKFGVRADRICKAIKAGKLSRVAGPNGRHCVQPGEVEAWLKPQPPKPAKCRCRVCERTFPWTSAHFPLRDGGSRKRLCVVCLDCRKAKDCQKESEKAAVVKHRLCIKCKKSFPATLDFFSLSSRQSVPDRTVQRLQECQPPPPRG